MSTIIPIYKFDEHNEAYYFWHKAKHDGILNKPLDLFHVDAHSDMGQLQNVSKSLYLSKEDNDDYLSRYHEIAYQDMSIANFIIPAVLNKIVRNVYFVYPRWRKFKRKQRITNVASAFGEGKVLKYGIKFQDQEKLKIEIAYPDITKYSYIETDIERIPSRRKIILDIDLDYFACVDSITNKMSSELLITAEQYRNRIKFIEENRHLQYSGLEIDFEVRGEEYFAIMRFKKANEKNYLPAESEIKREVDNLIDVLVAKKIQPAVITMCRSRISGYCPPDYSKMIEDYVVPKLRLIFPALQDGN